MSEAGGDPLRLFFVLGRTKMKRAAGTPAARLLYLENRMVEKLLSRFGPRAEQDAERFFGK